MLRLVVNDETCVLIEGLEILVGIVRKRDNGASVRGLHCLHAPPVWKTEKNEGKNGIPGRQDSSQSANSETSPFRQTLVLVDADCKYHPSKISTC